MVVAGRGKQGAHGRAVCRARSLTDEEEGESRTQRFAVSFLSPIINSFLPPRVSNPGLTLSHFAPRFCLKARIRDTNLPARVQAFDTLANIL